MTRECPRCGERENLRRLTESTVLCEACDGEWANDELETGDWEE